MIATTMATATKKPLVVIAPSLLPYRVQRRTEYRPRAQGWPGMSSHSAADLLARLPEGWSAVRYRGRRWGVSRTRLVGGRVEKLYAEELGGTGVVSANLYLPRGAAGEDDEQLRPCEMPATDVLDFLRGWQPLCASLRSSSQ